MDQNNPSNNFSSNNESPSDHLLDQALEECSLMILAISRYWQKSSASSLATRTYILLRKVAALKILIDQFENLFGQEAINQEVLNQKKPQSPKDPPRSPSADE